MSTQPGRRCTALGRVLVVLGGLGLLVLGAVAAVTVRRMSDLEPLEVLARLRPALRGWTYGMVASFGVLTAGIVLYLGGTADRLAR